MKNITPEWEIVHMKRQVHFMVNRHGESDFTVYLMHRGHAVDIKSKYLWIVEKIGPPYTGYICTHCNTVIPEEIITRWITMRKFLIPTT